MTASASRWAQAVLALPKPLLLAFDVDGTLAPFVPDPAAARVQDSVRQDLQGLSRCRGVRLALITGRDARSLAHVVRVPGAFRGVEHGRVIIAPGDRPHPEPLTAQERARLRAFEHWARDEVLPAGGHMEKKPRARTAHVRPLLKSHPKLARQLLKRAEEVARDHDLTVRQGRGVIEAELRSGDKGKALRSIRSRVRAKGVLFVGDDLTDHPAIAFAHEVGGVGLWVRGGSTGARPKIKSGTLASIEEVHALVSQLRQGLAPG
ncbi:MAG: trehalose-phosphatase [Myxococcales bacterium]|nr:trehalose-phosphatase [Myxococcales bacterium]